MKTPEENRPIVLKQPNVNEIVRLIINSTARGRRLVFVRNCGDESIFRSIESAEDAARVLRDLSGLHESVKMLRGRAVVPKSPRK